MLYLIKFEPKFHHCSYYFGWCKDGGLNRRFNQHLNGHGAKIIRAAIERGHAISIAFSCPGTPADEARLKKWENNARVLKHLQRNGWK